MNDISVKCNKLSNNMSRISSLLNTLYIISQKSSTHRIEQNKALIFEMFDVLLFPHNFCVAATSGALNLPRMLSKVSPPLNSLYAVTTALTFDNL